MLLFTKNMNSRDYKNGLNQQYWLEGLFKSMLQGFKDMCTYYDLYN